jgi:hypothetical protein
MAPEQARGEVGLIGRSTDVYGIGVVLFEALTGRRPFEAGSPEELLVRIQFEPAPSVRSLRREVPRDLDRIVRHCLEKEPGDRYATAAELAVNLRRFQRGEPLIPLRSPWKAAWSWARRHPATVGAAATLLVGAGAGLPLAARWARERGEEQVVKLVEARGDSLPDLIRTIDPEDDSVARAARHRLTDPRPAVRLRAATLLVGYGDREALAIALGGLAVATPEEVSLLAGMIRGGLPAGAAEETILNRLRGAVDEEDAAGMLRFSRLLHECGGAPPDGLSDRLIAALTGEEDPFPWAGHLSRGGPVGAGQAALEAGLERGDEAAGVALVALLAGSAGSGMELAELLSSARVDCRRAMLDELSVRKSRIVDLHGLLAALDSIAEGDGGPSARGDGMRAGAAVVLLRLGEPDGWARVARMLEAGSEPGARAQLIHLLGKLGTGPEEILARLAGGSSAGGRASLVLALGNTPLAGCGEDLAANGADGLLRWYELDPERTVHSACKWLLRKWAAELPAVAGRLAAIDDRLAAGSSRDPERGWWVHPTGITFLRVELPGLGRVVEVSDAEITVSQFRRWRKDHPTSDVLGHDPEGPAYYVDCSSAVGFCDWLSGQEGLGPDDRPSGLDPAGLLFPDPSKLDKPGYRLLTEEEFMALARGGSAATWHFGDAEELLAGYAWYTDNSGSRVHPVASLMPNDFGLFDTLGNAMEWCSADPATARAWPRNQVVKGGGYLHRADQVRAGWRLTLDLSFGGDLTKTPPVGFRVARTWPGPS